MAEKNDKAQEALQDAERPSIPPPAYQETSTTFIEPDDYHFVEASDTMPHDKNDPMEGPSTAALDEKKPTDTPSRALSIPKEKGPAYPTRPASPYPLQSSADHKDPDEILTVEEKKDVLTALPTLPSAEEEKKALQVHFTEAEQAEVAPELPKRPSAVRGLEDFSHDGAQLNLAPPILAAPPVASREVPLKYTFAWNRPLLNFPTLEITPANNATIPSASPEVPPTAHWRLSYHKKYHARLHRYTAAPTDTNRNTAQAGDFPFRQVAEVKFPEFLIPGVGCGATVKFDTHEEELARLGDYVTARGKKPLPRVQKFMQCEGWLTPSYCMEVPVLDHFQASWKTISRPRATKAGSGLVEAAQQTAVVERKTTDMEREAKKQNIKLLTIGDMIETAKRTINNENWTPYSPQQLIVDLSGHVVATYQRASPFAKHAGVLTINHPGVGQVSSMPEYIEGIIIATTAMVGMQDRIGLASGLMEAASTSGKWSQEQWLKVQREWKDRKAKRQSTASHPYGNAAAREEERSVNHDVKVKEVGSETFDDGLGGAISVQEREAARREQMAWDESAKAMPVVVDDGLAGVISAEEREAARREHLAWDERNRANASLMPVTATDPRQDTKGWEEKPKYVYA